MAVTSLSKNDQLIANPKQPFENSKGIKGIAKSLYHPTKDRRVNLDEIEEKVGFSSDLAKRIQGQAKSSIACLVLRGNLKEGKTDEGCYPKEGKIYECRFPNQTLAKKLEEEKGEKFGEEERFGDELPLGWGTAFLIAPQFALTAAHCIYPEESKSSLADKLYVVFGFYKSSSEIDKWIFLERQVYSIQEVVTYKLENIGTVWQDWALLKLDRPVKEGDSLKLNFHPISEKVRLYMLGHPWGLPMKLTYGAEVQKKSHTDYFEADLDAFRGNSGSPIFDEDTGDVIGILFHGLADYKPSENYKNTGKARIFATQISKQDIDREGFEKCQKISALTFVQDFLLNGTQRNGLVLNFPEPITKKNIQLLNPQRVLAI